MLGKILESSLEIIPDDLPPQASHVTEVTEVPIAPPRVRTVEEILEQTKISLTDISVTRDQTRSPPMSELEFSRNDESMRNQTFKTVETNEKAVDRRERTQRNS